MRNRPTRTGADPAQPSAQASAQASAQTSAEAEILPPEEKSNLQPCGTEALLDSLIVECRRLVREVATPSMCQTSDPLERIRFIDSAVSLIQTGAKVGETLARLRGVPAGEETRHRVFVEYVTPRPSAKPSPLAASRDDEDEEWG